MVAEDRAEPALLQDLVRGAAGGHRAVAQQHQLVGEGGRQVQVVGDAQHAEAVAGQAAEQGKEGGLVVQVEHRRRFVEQQPVGFLGQHAGD